MSTPLRLLTALLLGLAAGAWAVTLEQVISHENPCFNCRAARLTVGRDGMVYLYNGGNPTGYVLRLSRDGQAKEGTPIPYCTTALAANAEG